MVCAKRKVANQTAYPRSLTRGSLFASAICIAKRLQEVKNEDSGQLAHSFNIISVCYRNQHLNLPEKCAN